MLVKVCTTDDFVTAAETFGEHVGVTVGVSQDAIMDAVKAMPSRVDAVKFLREVYGFTLGEAVAGRFIILGLKETA